MNLIEALAQSVNTVNALNGQGRTDYTAQDFPERTLPLDMFDDVDEIDWENRYGAPPFWK